MYTDKAPCNYLDTMFKKPSWDEAVCPLPTISRIFFLTEANGVSKLSLVSKREALQAIAKHGTSVNLKAPLTLYYYVPTEDDWATVIEPVGSHLELSGLRSSAVPPFVPIQDILAQMGQDNFTRQSQFMHYFHAARKAGKFPWVQEPFEVFSLSSGKRGYVPVLELLYALEPESFDVLEHIINTCDCSLWQQLLIG